MLKYVKKDGDVSKDNEITLQSFKNKGFDANENGLNFFPEVNEITPWENGTLPVKHDAAIDDNNNNHDAEHEQRVGEKGPQTFTLKSTLLGVILGTIAAALVAVGTGSIQVRTDFM